LIFLLPPTMGSFHFFRATTLSARSQGNCTYPLNWAPEQVITEYSIDHFRIWSGLKKVFSGWLIICLLFKSKVSMKVWVQTGKNVFQIHPCKISKKFFLMFLRKSKFIQRNIGWEIWTTPSPALITQIWPQQAAALDKSN